MTRFRAERDVLIAALSEVTPVGAYGTVIFAVTGDHVVLIRPSWNAVRFTVGADTSGTFEVHPADILAILARVADPRVEIIMDEDILTARDSQGVGRGTCRAHPLEAS